MAEIEAGQAHVAHEAALEAPLHEYEEPHYVTVPFHGGVLHDQGRPMSNAEQTEQDRSKE